MSQQRKEENNGGNRITNYFSMKNITGKKTQSKGAQSDALDQESKRSQKGRKSSNNEQYRDSSREAHSDGTEVMEIPSKEFEDKYGYERGRHVTGENRKGDDNASENKKQVCQQFAFIGFYDVDYFESHLNKLQKIIEKYSRREFLQYLLQNAKQNLKTCENLNILQTIDDDEFWSTTIPTMLELATNRANQKTVSSLELLTEGETNKVVLISKAQCLMLIINMFLCLIPKQSFRSQPLSFAQWYGIKASDTSESTVSMRKEKLKCIINYLKVSVKRNYEGLQSQFLTLRRSERKIQPLELLCIDYELLPVAIKLGLIEQQYQCGIMVDFANERLGGGVLGNGAVQEQILFVCFPEMFVSMCLCEKMNESEAVLVEGAERFCEYEGYSTNFKFKGNYSEQDNGPFNSVIMAVDAINFSGQVMKSHTQYLPCNIERQIFKFIVGTQLTLELPEEMPICTGRWGCGAFGGDPHLKFIIQWIACSIGRRAMTYMAQDEQEATEMQTMWKFLKPLGTQELISALYDYHKFLKDRCYWDFLEYMKNMT